MRIDTGITSSACQVLVLTIWNVEVRLRIPVLLGQTKIDDVDLIPTLTNSHQEIVGLDITVYERLCVNVLYPRDKLICKEQDSLQGEFAVAEVEQIFQARPKQVEYHGVVVTFCAEPADKRDTDSSCQRLVDPCFIF